MATLTELTDATNALLTTVTTLSNQYTSVLEQESTTTGFLTDWDNTGRDDGEVPVWNSSAGKYQHAGLASVYETPAGAQAKADAAESAAVVTANAYTDSELASFTAVASDIQTFNASGTWTKPSGCTWVYVEAIGAGAGAENEPTDTYAYGGGGGAYADKLFLASSLGATETVTVGAGGAGGASGSNTFGSDGGDSTFGAHLTAKGGKAFKTSPAQTCESGDGIPPLSTGLTGTRQIGGLGGAPGGMGAGSASVTVHGGNAVKGGAGGGARNGVAVGTGGVSQYGGNGGNANNTASTKGGNGSQPGGGGGASANDGGGGDGGDGRIVVYSW